MHESSENQLTRRDGVVMVFIIIVSAECNEIDVDVLCEISSL